MPPTRLATTGRPARHGLQDREREAFEAGGVHEHVSRAQDAVDVVAQTEEVQAIGDPERARLLPQGRFLRPASRDRGPRTGHLRQRRDEGRVALDRVEVADRDGERTVGRETELGARLGATLPGARPSGTGASGIPLCTTWSAERAMPRPLARKRGEIVRDGDDAHPESAEAR